MSQPKYNFTTTAARIAYAFDLNDVGEECRDLENNSLYKIITAGAGANNMVNLSSLATRDIGLALTDWLEVSSTNDVSNIAANGGVLASDTTPAAQADGTFNTMEISWVTGNADLIGRHVSLPGDFDGTRDVTLSLEVYSGTTNDATMAVITSWDNSTPVTDSAAETTRSATRHTITSTIAAADIPDAPKNLTISINPPTHATDAIALCGAKLTYYRK